MNQINLVPVEYKKREKRKWYLLFGALGSASVIALLVTLALIPVFKINSAKKEHQRLTEALATKDMVETRMILDETEQAYIKNTVAAKLLGTLDVPSHITRQTMDVVVGSVPKGLRMNSVNMTKDDRSILVEGNAQDTSKVAQYITQLYNTGQFEILEYTANQEGNEQIGGWIGYSIKIQPKFFVDYDAAEENIDLEESQDTESEDTEDAEEEEVEETL